MDDFEDDWADPFSDEPRQAPPPKPTKIPKESRDSKLKQPTQSSNDGQSVSKAGIRPIQHNVPKVVILPEEKEDQNSNELPRASGSTKERSRRRKDYRSLEESETTKQQDSTTQEENKNQEESRKQEENKDQEESKKQDESQTIDEDPDSPRGAASPKDSPRSRGRKKTDSTVSPKRIKSSKSLETAKASDTQGYAVSLDDDDTPKEVRRTKSKRKPREEEETQKGDAESAPVPRSQWEVTSKKSSSSRDLEITTFDQAIATLNKPRSKRTDNAQSFVAELFDRWLQKSPIRRMFRPSNIQETKTEILSGLIKELKKQTLDEIVALYFEQADDLIKQLKDEAYQELWDSRIQHFSKALIAASTLAYWNKIEGPGYKQIWSIGSRYGKEEIQSAVLKSLLDSICNFPNIPDFRSKSSAVPNKVKDFRASQEFLALNFMQLKELFEFLKFHLALWDKLLLGFISWLLQDESYLLFQKNVFLSIKECRFSKNCVNSLMDNEEVVKYPKVASMLRTMGREVSSRRRITVFSEYRNKEGNSKDHKTMNEEGEPGCCVQQFDVDSFSWMSLQTMPLSTLSEFVMCQYQDHIMMVGGMPESNCVCIKYDIQENIIEYKGTTKFETFSGSSMGAYNDSLYVTEGQATGSKVEVVYCRIQTEKWIKVQPLLHPSVSNAIILATADKIYVIHGQRRSYADLIIDFNTFTDYRQPWETITKVPGDGRNLYSENFCVLGNTLCCVYKVRNDLIEAWYDHNSNSWEKRVCAGMMSIISAGLGFNSQADIMRVCQFPERQALDPYLLLTIGRDNADTKLSVIPNVVWNWGSDNRIEDILLPHQHGKREVGFTDTTKVVYTVGI